MAICINGIQYDWLMTLEGRKLGNIVQIGRMGPME